MDLQRRLEILNWYTYQGLDEITSNDTRDYLKNKETKNKINTSIIESTVAYIPEINETPINQNIDRSSYTVNNQSNKHMPPSKSESLARDLASKCNSLEDLKSAVLTFEGCGLKKTAMNTVFADGNPSADILMIGEAPGANEDIQGIPFCGDSGKLLDKILESIGYTRDANLYVTNSVFWRPPGNRKPSDEEIKSCLPFLEKHIAIINPKLILLVGSISASTLFGNLGPISKQRQKIFQYKNQYLDKELPATITFHPSYLLRQPSQKKMAWHDMLFIKKYLDNL